MFLTKRIHFKGQRFLAFKGFYLLVFGIFLSWISHQSLASFTSKQAVGTMKSELGKLEPWQDKVFEDEIVPMSDEFVSNSRTSAQGTEIVVDRIKVRKYLSINATEGFTSVGVFLRPGSGCKRCLDFLPIVEKMIQRRFQRRGLQASFITKEEVGDERLFGKALMEKVTEIATKKNLTASLVMTWGRLESVDVDSAHADEILYSAFVGLKIPHFRTKFEDSFDTRDIDTMDSTLGKLFTHAWIAAGEDALAHRSSQGKGKQNEVWLVISGIRNYEFQNQLRQSLSQGMSDGASLELKEIEKGKVTFSVKTEMGSELVLKELLSVSPPVGHQWLKKSNFEGNRVFVEVQ